jgi:hypothetical protein
MGIEDGVHKRLDALAERQLLTFNEASIVRGIEPGDTSSASTWLLWASFGVEQCYGLDAITFPEAFVSRRSNISDYLRFAELELPDYASHQTTWGEANRIITSLDPAELPVVRGLVRTYMASHPEIPASIHFA